jgi:tetratricopeptide (TPR) repeat protein
MVEEVNSAKIEAQAYVAQGKLLNQQGQAKEAVVAFDKAIELNPQQPFWVYKVLGDALAKDNQLDRAIAVYHQAVDLKPENPSVYQGLGQAENLRGNYSEAIHYYQKAISLDAEPPFWVYKNLAYALVQTKDFAQAVTNYQKAIALQPDKSELYVALGNLYLQQKQPDLAFDCYLQAVNLQPDSRTSYGKLGYFHGGHAPLSEHQLNRAINTYRQAITNCPQFFLPYAYLGDVFTSKSNLNAAISCYRKAGEIKLFTKYPEYRQSSSSLEPTKQPHFIIIGAGKSGTSSLYEYIGAHPQVIPAIKKEIRFFNYQPNLKQGLDWYLAHFPPGSRENSWIFGEATPGYFGNEVQAMVKSALPQVKLIAILRNPVDRAISQYHHWVRNGIETRSVEAAFIPELEKLERLFSYFDISEIDRSDRLKQLCYEIRQGNSKDKNGYLWEGLYVYFLKRWLNYFPSEQLLILNSQDFYNQTASVMEKVFAFLELPNQTFDRYQKYNSGKYNSIDRPIYDRLSSFFQVHNQRLADCFDIHFGE